MSNHAPSPRIDRRTRKAFKLTHPILVENQEVAELELPERIQMGDLIAGDLAKGEMEKMTLIIAQLAGIPYSSAKMLDPRDVLAGSPIAQHIEPFLLPQPKATGEESPASSPLSSTSVPKP